VSYVEGDVVEVVDEHCQHRGCIGTVTRKCCILGATVVVKFDGEHKRWGVEDEWVPYAEWQVRRVAV
jgi:hypothetical protein